MYVCACIEDVYMFPVLKGRSHSGTGITSLTILGRILRIPKVLTALYSAELLVMHRHFPIHTCTCTVLQMYKYTCTCIQMLLQWIYREDDDVTVIYAAVYNIPVAGGVISRCSPIAAPL